MNVNRRVAQWLVPTFVWRFPLMQGWKWLPVLEFCFGVCPRAIMLTRAITSEGFGGVHFCGRAMYRSVIALRLDEHAASLTRLLTKGQSGNFGGIQNPVALLSKVFWQDRCVVRQSRSRFRTDGDHDSWIMPITIGAKRRWRV